MSKNFDLSALARNIPTNIASESYVTTAISNVVDTAPTALDTLNELAASLGDDANFASTVTTALGLKAPSASPTFTGTTTLQQTVEVLNLKNGATGTVAHDFSTGTIWYHSSAAANFTVNFTNVPTSNSKAISAVLVIYQNTGPYLPTAVEIDGTAQTILWQGADAPTGTINQMDVVSFTLIRVSSSWIVLGSVTTYGVP